MDPLLPAAGATARRLTGAASDSQGDERPSGAFIQQVSGSAISELNASLGDRVLVWRATRQLRALEKLQADLAAKRRDPRSVKWNVLFPLLEATALEEDAGMADRWAALLSTAADPARPEVPPSFPEVLRQMTPLDAQALEIVARHEVASKLEDLVLSPVMDVREGAFADLEVAAVADLLRQRSPARTTLEELLLTISNLERLRLVEVEGEKRRPLRRRLSATVFGLAFVKACTPTTH